MPDKKPLIVGIDPGTTLGYAFLDLDGQLIETGSGKQFPIHLLIKKAVAAGKPIFVGTDKKAVPASVQEFAAKTGARIIAPPEDLKVQEKNEWVVDSEIKNDHERDALAAALFAYNEQAPLLRKIEKFAKDHNKEEIKDALQMKVLRQGINIRDAAVTLESTAQQEEEDKPRITEQKLPVNRDIIELMEQLRRVRKENRLVREQNAKLKRKLSEFKRKQRREMQKLESRDAKAKDATMLRFKENRIHYFDNALREKSREIESIEIEKKQLLFFLGKLNGHILLKKFSHLGQEEWEQRNPVLNVREGDVLLVDNPNIFSEGILERIRGKVDVIAHKQPVSDRIRSQLPFIFIPAGHLRIEENEYFAIAPKKDIEREKHQQGMLQKIVEDYRKERMA